MFNFKKKNDKTEDKSTEVIEEEPMNKHQREKAYKTKTLVFAAIFFAVATWLFIDYMAKIADTMLPAADELTAGEWWTAIQKIFPVILSLLPALISALVSLMFAGSVSKSKRKPIALVGLVLALVSLAYIIIIIVLTFFVEKQPVADETALLPDLLRYVLPIL